MVHVGPQFVSHFLERSTKSTCAVSIFLLYNYKPTLSYLVYVLLLLQLIENYAQSSASQTGKNQLGFSVLVLESIELQRLHVGPKFVSHFVERGTKPVYSVSIFLLYKCKPTFSYAACVVLLLQLIENNAQNSASQTGKNQLFFSVLVLQQLQQ